MDITLATRDDLPVLDPLVRYPGLLLGDGAETYDYLGISFNNGHMIYKCELDNQIVGLLSFNLFTRFLEIFSIDHNHRGKGLYKLMMDHMLSSHGEPYMFVHTITLHEKMANILKKYGFRNEPISETYRYKWVK